jgi:lysophospholipase L1-like esterase
MNEKIVLIGDSITFGFETKELLPEFNIVNKGIYGDNTTGVLVRLENDVIKENPDKVFVLIGTNDFALERSDEELINNISEILDELSERLKDAKIYLTPLLPTLNIDNRPNDRIRGVNLKLRLLTEKYKINYFDLYNKLVNVNGELNVRYTIDGLHLSEAAYKIWADFLKEELQK